MVNGPDFKVGKTDIIDRQGNRVVTETTNQTLDGQSIWTIKQEFDYDNDGTMDAYRMTTETYDENTGKLLNRRIETNEHSVKNGKGNNSSVDNEQFLYETATGNLVKINETSDNDNDGTIDYRGTYRYEYNDEGVLVREKYYTDESKENPLSTTDYEYDGAGNLKKRVSTADRNYNGIYDGADIRHEYVYDQSGNLISSSLESPDGCSTVLEYDSEGNMISDTFTDTDGTVRVYDSNGNLVSKTRPIKFGL